jgi:hypothetical protein
MRWVGGNNVMSFNRAFSENGAMSQDCVVDLDGMHVVLGVSDLYMHNGTAPQSILSKSMRRWLFDQIDAQYYERSFLAKSVHTHEILVCYPSVGSSACDKALVWNYKDNTFGVRDLPNVRAASNGAIEASLNHSWSSSTATWETVTGVWAETSAIPDEQRLVMASPSNTKIYLMESSNKNNGSYISASMERTGLSLGSPETIKLITRIRPRFSSNSGAAVSISVGSCSDVYGTYTWSTPQTFTIGTDYKVDALLSGRYLGYRITSTAALDWRLEGIDFDIEPGGAW